VETIKRQTGVVYSCLVAGQSPSERDRTAAYTLYARSVCDTKALLQLQYAACGAISSVICLCLWLCHWRTQG